MVKGEKLVQKECPVQPELRLTNYYTYKFEDFKIEVPPTEPGMCDQSAYVPTDVLIGRFLRGEEGTVDNRYIDPDQEIPDEAVGDPDQESEYMHPLESRDAYGYSDVSTALQTARENLKVAELHFREWTKKTQAEAAEKSKAEKKQDTPT